MSGSTSEVHLSGMSLSSTDGSHSLGVSCTSSVVHSLFVGSHSLGMSTSLSMVDSLGVSESLSMSASLGMELSHFVSSHLSGMGGTSGMVGAEGLHLSGMGGTSSTESFHSLGMGGTSSTDGSHLSGVCGTSSMVGSHLSGVSDLSSMGMLFSHLNFPGFVRFHLDPVPFASHELLSVLHELGELLGLNTVIHGAQTSTGTSRNLLVRVV